MKKFLFTIFIPYLFLNFTHAEEIREARALVTATEKVPISSEFA